VADTSGELQLETNESYILKVGLSATLMLTYRADASLLAQIPDNGGMATITAATVFGAMHGLETLSQLIAFDFDARVRRRVSAVMLS